MLCGCYLEILNFLLEFGFRKCSLKGWQARAEGDQSLGSHMAPQPAISHIPRTGSVCLSLPAPAP